MAPKSFKASLIILSSMLILSLSSCAITRLTTWTDPNYKGGSIKKFAVFGLFKKISNRSIFERTMVAHLNQEGVQAVASIDLIPPDQSPRDREKRIDQLTHACKADGILIFRVISIDKETEYIPGEPHYYFNYYWHTWDLIQIPSYEVRTIKVSLDMRLYANSTDRLVWSAESDTYDPDSMQETATSVGRKIIKSLRQKGLLAERAGEKK